MVQLFVFSEYFKEKEKREPITGAHWLRFWIFDVTKNVTELVKIRPNGSKCALENPNILCFSIALPQYIGVSLPWRRRRDSALFTQNTIYSVLYKNSIQYIVLFQFDFCYITIRYIFEMISSLSSSYK